MFVYRHVLYENLHRMFLEVQNFALKLKISLQQAKQHRKLSLHWDELFALPFIRRHLFQKNIELGLRPGKPKNLPDIHRRHILEKARVKKFNIKISTSIYKDVIFSFSLSLTPILSD